MLHYFESNVESLPVEGFYWDVQLVLTILSHSVKAVASQKNDHEFAVAIQKISSHVPQEIFLKSLLVLPTEQFISSEGKVNTYSKKLIF